MGVFAYLLFILWAAKGQGQKWSRHDSKPATDKHTNNPYVIPARVQICFSEEDKKERRTHEEQQYAMQQSLKRASWLTFWSVSIYAAITLAIFCVNKRAADAAHETLVQIQTQTKLMQEQLIGTQAAIVAINGPMGVQPLPLRHNVNISIGFRNDGHVIAKKFSMRLKIQVLNLADKTLIGNQWSCDHAITAIPPPRGAVFTPEEHPYIQCFIEGLTNEDLKLISELKRTIAVDGTYAYDNGFDEMHETALCFRFQPEIRTGYGPGNEGSNNFEDCGTFNVGRDIILRHLREPLPKQQ